MTNVIVIGCLAFVLAAASLWRMWRVRIHLRRLASWPDVVGGDREVAVRELLEQAASVLSARRVEAMWRSRDGVTYVASLAGNRFDLREVPESTEPAPSAMSIPFESQTVRGSLCIPDRREHALAEIVAKLVAAGLDRINLMEMMRDRTVAERFRLAHAKPELFTGRNRLSSQLARMTHDIASQWEVEIALDADRNVDILDASLARQLMSVVAEGLINAAKHAGATRIRCNVQIDERSVRVDIADDGHGFPFHGRYELPQLVAEQRGPWSLKERIVALGGELAIDSSARGSRVEVRLPRAS